MNLLTEVAAWEQVARAFANLARTGRTSRISEYGLCTAVVRVLRDGGWVTETHVSMNSKIDAELQALGLSSYDVLAPYGRANALNRAALAYLFAAECREQLAAAVAPAYLGLAGIA